MNMLKTKKTQSQCEKILVHLQAGKSINPIQALNLYGCFGLGARIHDLKKDGNFIDTKMIYKNGSKYAEYSMRGD